MKVRHLRKRKPRGRPLPRLIRMKVDPNYWLAEYTRLFGPPPPGWYGVTST